MATTVGRFRRAAPGWYTTAMTGVQPLADRVRELRAGGHTPKEIARALGVRPAEVTAIVRRLGREAAAGEPELVGAWVSHGWSVGLTVDGHPEWPADPLHDEDASGLACVAVARRHRSRRVSVCGYLVDVYCLGVKNALGPKVLDEYALPGFHDSFFAGIRGTPPLEVPLDLARHLVWGAVDYARSLGFEPHPDFAATAGHLGAWGETSAITFGRDGTPLYISGPHDSPTSVISTLARAVGKENFHYVVGAPAGW